MSTNFRVILMRHFYIFSQQEIDEEDVGEHPEHEVKDEL